MTLRSIAARPEHWAGRCVRVRGIVVGPLFIERREDLLRVDDLVSLPKPVVALRLKQGNAPTKVVRAEVVGRLGDRAASARSLDAYLNDNPGHIAWPGGYCHTSLSRYIEVDAFRMLAGRPLARLLEADVPPLQRALVEAPPATPRRVEAKQAADQLVGAIAKRDFERFASAMRPGSPYERRGEPALRELRRDFAGTAPLQPAAQAILAHPEWPRRLLVDRPVAGAEPSDDLPYRFACYCKSRDCQGLWPVTGFDADSDPGRPYLCVALSDYVSGGRRFLAAAATTEPALFVEPR